MSDTKCTCPWDVASNEILPDPFCPAHSDDIRKARIAMFTSEPTTKANYTAFTGVPKDTATLEERIKRWQHTSPRTKAPTWYEQFTSDLIEDRQRLLDDMKQVRRLINDLEHELIAAADFDLASRLQTILVSTWGKE